MKKRTIIISAAVAIILIIWAIVMTRKDRETPPPTLTANFINLDKVEKISKFRSCQGHTVVPQDGSERLRNMKHYVVLKPEYFGKKIEIFSPVDGFIHGIRSNPAEGLEGEIGIGQNGSDWSVSFEHIILLNNLKEKQKIKAGELIGYVPDRGLDLVYSAGGEGMKYIDGWQSPFGSLDSAFNHMSQEVLKEYQAKGLGGRGDMIYSREFRDQHPCRLMTSGNAQSGQLNDFEHPEDWVFLK